MTAIASQITSLAIFYLTVYSRRRSKKTSKLRVTGLCEGNSPVTDEFPAQRASNTENVSIWCRHHVYTVYASMIDIVTTLFMMSVVYPPIVSDSYRQKWHKLLHLKVLTFDRWQNTFVNAARWSLYLKPNAVLSTFYMLNIFKETWICICI